MKKQINIFVGLLILLTISSVTAIHAQSQTAVKVQIPFEFSMRNQTIEAGSYEVKRQDDKNNIWILRGLDNDLQMILLTSNAASKSDFSNGKLTFHKYGNKYFLAAVETSIYQIKVHKSRDEKNLVKELKNNRLAKNNEKNIKPEIVAINLER